MAQIRPYRAFNANAIISRPREDPGRPDEIGIVRRRNRSLLMPNSLLEIISSIRSIARSQGRRLRFRRSRRVFCSSFDMAPLPTARIKLPPS